MIKKYIFPAVILYFLLSLAGVGCNPAPSPRTGQATLALINGTLIDGTGADPVADAVVLMAGNRILSAGSGDKVLVPDGIKTIDLRGATILPGFINAHVHSGFKEANLQAWAWGGVTTVCDQAVISGSGSLTDLMAFRNRVRSNPRNSRLVSFGAMITVHGGYGSLLVGSPGEARQAVLDEIGLGVDGIKLSLEDGYAGRHGLPKLSAEELSAIVSAAHQGGLFVSGHITQGSYIRPMIDAGVDLIAHVPYDYFPLEDIRQMVDKGIYLTPTFTVYRNYRAPVSTCVQNLRRFVESGGKVALGSDYSGGPGEFELGIPMYEIEMMSEAGMTPMQIILACTTNAAHVANLEGELGTLKPGKAADLLVVNGDPLNDLQVLKNILLVVHDGVVIRNGIQ